MQWTRAVPQYFWGYKMHCTKGLFIIKLLVISYRLAILSELLTNMSSTSTTSLLPSQSRQQQHQQPSSSNQKDWASAFATLSSKYGFGGKGPSLPENHHSSKPGRVSPPTTFPSVGKPQPPPLTGYELAFGQLASNYGFGGGAITSQNKK